MKVYVITQGEYSDYHIVGVTLDKAVADKCIKTHKGYGFYEPRVEVYDTDEFKKYAKPCWRVQSWTPLLIERDELYSYDDNDWIIYADTLEHAIKIAGERKAKMLAERAGL